jgi:hypothetical protein
LKDWNPQSPWFIIIVFGHFGASPVFETKPNRFPPPKGSVSWVEPIRRLRDDEFSSILVYLWGFKGGPLFAPRCSSVDWESLVSGVTFGNVASLDMPFHVGSVALGETQTQT